ncbi:hypothetical protein KHQ81_06450 [Mycoplasmatota bacterium]|nr:hypothetical protein KHQ81_06450 [Mycoplasmatota bacterium]
MESERAENTPDINNNSYNENKGALDQLGKEIVQNYNRKGKELSEEEAFIIDEWCKEYGVSQHHGIREGSGEHWTEGYDHTHISYLHEIIG